jgi:hypothetical protein
VERASATELLETLLSHDLGREILALAATDRRPVERLRRAGSPLADRRLDYAEAVAGLVEDPSEGVRAFAMYHAAELPTRVRDEDRTRREPARARAASLRKRALEIIEGLPEALPRAVVGRDEKPAGA